MTKVIQYTLKLKECDLRNSKRNQVIKVTKGQLQELYECHNVFFPDIIEPNCNIVIDSKVFRVIEYVDGFFLLINISLQEIRGSETHDRWLRYCLMRSDATV